MAAVIPVVVVNTRDRLKAAATYQDASAVSLESVESSVEIRTVPRIAGALLLRPILHADERGFFCRTFDADAMRAAGLDLAPFVQDSLSRSAQGVVRGLHVRRGTGEAKLVRCSYGAIFDVVLDLRPDSPTYRNWESFDLSGDTQESLYVPAGCAHGFQALTEPADVSYRIDRAHNPAEDVSVAFDDPELAIPWPLAISFLSDRDRHAQPLSRAIRSLSGNDLDEATMSNGAG